MSRRHISILIAVGLLLISTSCGARNETSKLRIGVLPILDTLPIYVADEETIFAQNGLQVEFVKAVSAAERDQLLQAGKVDGIITDLVALALYNRDDPRVVAVRYAMIPTPDFPQFRIMASKASGMKNPEDLIDVEIGVSEGTVIEYVTDRMLEAEGLAPEQIDSFAVPKIPDRMALLRAGELDAATLPEPLASLAMQDGALSIVDDTDHIETSCSVYAFRKQVVEEHPEDLRRFLRAIGQASERINADTSQWRDLLADKGLIPKPLIGSYDLPPYPDDEVPSEGQFADAVSWLQEKDQLREGPRYAMSVDGSFLP